jgi:hypothetical protein
MASTAAAYGTTILKLVSDLTPRRQVAGLVGISEGKAHLKRRLRNIASHRKPTRWTTVTGVMALFCLTGVTLTDARTIRGASELSAEAGRTALAQVESQPQSPTVPTPDTSAPANQGRSGSGRQRIEAKLQRTVLDEVQFDGLTLPDVLRYLGEVVRQQDPDGQGINFLISPQSMAVSQVPVVDSTSGELIPAPEVEPTDMNSVRIRIDPAIRSVRLGKLLEAITRGADKPIAYLIEEYAIVFTPRPPELGVQLETRIFKVNVEKLIESQRQFGPADNLIENSPSSDHIVGIPADGEESNLDLLSMPRVFELEDEAAAGLPGVTSTNLTEQMREAQLALRRFLRSAGVSVVPPNQIHFSYRRGLLMVHATTQELDNLQIALEALGGAQRKIELEVRAVELTRTESGEMGFDWFLGNTEAKPKSAGVFPGGPASDRDPSANTPTTADDSRAPTPTSFKLTGILTEHQFSVVLGALEQRPDTEIISLPRVTTASGQPTRISWITAAGSTVEVHCLPVAGSDGYSLDLQLTVDYGDNPSDEMDPAGITATPASARQSSTRRAVVWTGQTMVMGGLISESVSETRTKHCVGSGT